MKEKMQEGAGDDRLKQVVWKGDGESGISS